MKEPIMIRFLFTIILLTISCSDSKDTRANRDLIIGAFETENYVLKTEKGILNPTQADTTNLTVRAGSPEFTAQLSNKTSQAITIQLTVSNIPLQLNLKADDEELSDIDSLQGSLEKSWEIIIPENSSVQLESSQNPAEPFEFLAFGDIQDGIDNFIDVVNLINQQANIDFVLFLGDLTMNSDLEEFQKIEEMFAKINFPIYSTPGNHDVRSSTRYQDYFGKASYSWDYRSVRFTSVDSASWTLSKSSWEQYKSWLQQAKNQTHIVFSHIAPTEPFGLRGGHWRSRREANAFIAESSRADVDAMFYGHLHTLDIYSLAGIPVYISGGGGAFQEFFDGIERHFLKVSVNPSNSQIGVSIVRVD